VITCPGLDDIPSGSLNLVPEDLPSAVGTVASYTCVEGFQLTGPETRQCTAVNGEGVWTGEDPSCICMSFV